MARRTGRPKAGENSLNPERILDTALEIVDREGMDALSMRRLGTELNVDPMAIYHHLPNKQAIIEGMVQRVFDEIPRQAVSSESATWQERVKSWAQDYRAVARRHANLIVHLVNHADAATDSVMQANEDLYAALETSGLKPRDILRAADMIADYVHGVILAEGVPTTGDAEWRDLVLERLRNAPPGELDAIGRVYESLTPEDLEFDFAFGLDVIIAGLERKAGTG